MASDEVGSGRAYEAARLRWATQSDGPRLAELFRRARRDAAQESAAEMEAWLEHGGAAVLEDAHGRLLCALRWREQEGAGWEVDRIATTPEARGQGFGRWLMTKVEALAIRRNVPTLTLTLDEQESVPYYQRMGYREAERDDHGVTLAKRVGGTWQRQPGS